MKKFFFNLSVIIFLLKLTVSKAQTADFNLTLQSNVNWTNAYSNIWGYVDTVGNEYALVGTWEGVSIFNVTDPVNPVLVSSVPSAQPASGTIVWREIKIFNKHAYVTNEQDSALLIINLTNLPSSNISYHHFFSNDLKRAHTCFVDENGILYLFGFNTYNGLSQAQRGAMIFDLNADPDNPTYLGQYNGNYIHDGFVRGDTLWAAEVYQGRLEVFNVSDPNNFVSLAQITTPLAFTHNSWPTHDNHYTFTTDEKPNGPLASYDVANLGNISHLDNARSNPGSNSAIHNVHLYNDDFAVVSYYRDGVVIFDVSDPSNIIEVGAYDTYAGSGQGYDGDWGVYPWLPSHNLIISDMQSGLFVLAPHYQKACRLQGVVTDTFSSALLNGVMVQILSQSVYDSTDFTGVYKTGLVNQGLYDIQFSHPGYFTKVIHNVQLDSAQTVILNVQLVPDIPFDITITVNDSATGDPIPNAEVYLTDNFQYSFSFTADASGVAHLNQIYTLSYDIYAGKWGHVTRKLSSVPLDSSSLGFAMALPAGYYDDFLFDFGWTPSGTASTGAWERAVPVETVNGNHISNPGVDVTNDFGSKCFVTDNGGGNAADHDVDNGSAILTSPVFDLSNSYDPRINCYKWFYDGGGSGVPNDSLKLFISNGDSTKLIDYLIADTSTLSQWLYEDFRIKDFVELSNNMTFIIRTADQSTTGNILEAGFDRFEVIDTAKNISVPEIFSENDFMIYPNPVSDKLSIISNQFEINEIEIMDVLGRGMETFHPKDNRFQTDDIVVDVSRFSAGVFFLRLKLKNGSVWISKFVKQ